MNAVTTFGRKIRLSFCLALAALLCCTAAHAAKKPGKDRLAEALSLLNQAKDSTSPVSFLYQAKEEVEGTLIPHKDPEREKAIQSIADAITACTVHSGEQKAIGRAIASVRSLAGMGDGAKKKKK